MERQRFHTIKGITWTSEIHCNQWKAARNVADDVDILSTKFQIVPIPSPRTFYLRYNTTTRNSPRFLQRPKEYYSRFAKSWKIILWMMLTRIFTNPNPSKIFSVTLWVVMPTLTTLLSKYSKIIRIMSLKTSMSNISHGSPVLDHHIPPCRMCGRIFGKAVLK